MLKKRTLKDDVGDELLRWIIQEGLRKGDKLLSEKTLASRLNVNHLTIRSALDVLAADEIVERVPRSGTYVKNIPNPLVAADEKMVAVIMRTEGHVYEDLVTQIVYQLRQNDYKPVIIPFMEQGIDEMCDWIEDFWDQGGAKAIIMEREGFYRERVAERLSFRVTDLPKWLHIIWLNGNTLPHNFIGDVVVDDLSYMMEKAVSLLRRKGHERIVHLTHALNEADTSPDSYSWRITQFTNAMCKNHLVEGLCILTQTCDEADDIERAKRMFTQPDRPTAVIGDIDSRLVFLKSVLDDLDLRVPKDVAMIGRGNTPWAERYDLTSFDFEVEKYAEQVVELLNENSDQRRTVKREPLLVERSSSG